MPFLEESTVSLSTSTPYTHTDIHVLIFFILPVDQKTVARDLSVVRARARVSPALIHMQQAVANRPTFYLSIYPD